MDRINKLILTPFLAIAIMTGAAAFSPKARAASDDVCQGFPIKQRITRLGGPNAFAEGATMNSVADLQDLFNKYETDIRQVLETQGMSEVSDSLFEAVANGQGISEGIVNPGDTFEWMAWRKQGKPTTTSPTCLATSTYYDSFDIRVQTEDDNQITTHTFTAPKICLNLALVNVEKATKPAPEPAAEAPQYSDPSCSISASAYEVQATEPIEINVTGYWARDTGEGIQVEVVNSEGVTVASVPPPYPATVTLDKAGTYTLRGLATNEAGATATCETQVLAERKRRWTLRPFFAYVNPSNDDIQQSRVRPNGVLERSTLSFGGGAGAGISAEYHFTDLIGLEGAVIFAQLDSRFMLDLDEAWETDKDDISFTSLTIGPNFHLTRNMDKVDLYVGPFVGVVNLGDGSYRTLGEQVRRSFDDDFVVGAQIGVDVSIMKSSPWKLHAGLRYMDFTADEERTDTSADVDPMILTIGASRDF